jgi:ABC-type glycerol-3-phosphate transport system substrate-binding protein
VPKKAVTIFFLLAFLGAALFIYFTFPRTKDQIPTSNNQRPFPSAPMPSQPTPNGVPVPETVPHPNTPHVPPGPTLHVMAWASAAEARALEAEADAFGDATGRHASLTIDSNPTAYRQDLRQALDSDSPPDVVLVSSRDFSGLDPSRDLGEAVPAVDSAPRSIAAFTVDGQIKAAPNEFSVMMLFYNRTYFEQAGIGYPDRHWNWDILEADARALDSLHLKDATGHPVYPLELNPDFDFWNILCTQAGHPALDLDTWHLGDNDTKESQMRGLEVIHDLFQGLAITAPAVKGNDAPGRLFAQQRTVLLIAPSDLTGSLPYFPYGITLLPRDLVPASSARVNGWAVTARSTQADAARDLAAYLAVQPVHVGWMSVQKPSGDDSPQALCYEALGEALVPRINAKTARMAQIIGQQIGQLAHDDKETTDDLYAQIQATFQKDPSEAGHLTSVPAVIDAKPKVDASSQLRGL